jgi:hypothetical protein
LIYRELQKYSICYFKSIFPGKITVAYGLFLGRVLCQVPHPPGKQGILQICFQGSLVNEIGQPPVPGNVPPHAHKLRSAEIAG